MTRNQRRAREITPVSYGNDIGPVDLEAERAVLGAMLLDVDAARRALELLDCPMLSQEPHRLLFRAMGAVVQRGDVIDPVTLRDELLRRGELDGVGGLEYIGALIDVVPTAANVDSHAAIVRRQATARELVKQAGVVIAALTAADGNRAHLETAAARLPDLLRAVLHGGCSPALDAVEAMLVRASDVQPTPVSWLWHRRVPLGKLTLLSGDPGLGKSTLLLDLAARVSRRRSAERLPDGHRELLAGS